MTALIVIGVLLWLLWPSRSKWHPFGGMFRRDRKTGAIVMALTLPTKRRKKGRRR